MMSSTIRTILSTFYLLFYLIHAPNSLFWIELFINIVVIIINEGASMIINDNSLTNFFLNHPKTWIYITITCNNTIDNYQHNFFGDHLPHLFFYCYHYSKDLSKIELIKAPKLLELPLLSIS